MGGWRAAACQDTKQTTCPRSLQLGSVAVAHLGGGEAEHERAAAAGAVGVLQRAPLHLRERLRDRETESGVPRVGERARGAIERIEDARALGGLDTRSAVGDGEREPPVLTR